jgi:hypothetical protein
VRDWSSDVCSSDLSLVIAGLNYTRVLSLATVIGV